MSQIHIDFYTEKVDEAKFALSQKAGFDDIDGLNMQLNPKSIDTGNALAQALSSDELEMILMDRERLLAGLVNQPVRAKMVKK